VGKDQHWGCTGTSIALKERIESLGFEITSFPINETRTFKEIPPFELFDDPESFKLFCEKNKEAVETISSSR